MIKQFFIRLWKQEEGQDLVEYALIVAAVGLALITTVNQLSTAIVSLYSCFHKRIKNCLIINLLV